MSVYSTVTTTKQEAIRTIKQLLDEIDNATSDKYFKDNYGANFDG